jgi:type IV pilus assembly protein PilA
MLARIRKAMDEKDEGFTLIELLVVIIIIGILAAIAIPVFLNQRKKGYDAQVKSDLRNAATAEETYLTDYSAYTTSQSATTGLGLSGLKTSTNDTLLIGVAGSNDYCIVGNNTSSPGHFFLYDSASGGLKTTIYATAAAAEGACSDAAITTYA